MPNRSANRIHSDPLHVALVFPAVHGQNEDGVPPAGDTRAPSVPTPSSFHGESIDFVLFPEGYVRVQDNQRIRALSRLAIALRAQLLVGAVDRRTDPFRRLANWQVLLHFHSDGTHPRVYTKHSTADAIAFGEPDWDPNTMLPTFEIGGVSVGATICVPRQRRIGRGDDLPRPLSRSTPTLSVFARHASVGEPELRQCRRPQVVFGPPPQGR